ncbi:MAG: DUF3500 domain-containing protein [Aureliella sp.]
MFVNFASRKSVAICSGILVLGGLISFAVAQRRGQRGNPAAALAEPYRGISAGGEIEKGLFKIESTGVSTQPVIDAAKKLIDGLSDEQRKRTLFPVDDKEWRTWDNRHSPKREGVGFDEMTEEQRELAFGLMQASLSAKGLKLSKDIMKLNHHLGELANNFDEYGQWLYWITIMGEPSATEPWGWQVDGHHLIINYFVLGDQVVMSPVFIGSEPVRADSGKFKGTEILQVEQNMGLEMIRALDAEQQKSAILTTVKDGNNALTQAYKDNVDLDYAGIQGDKLNEQQKELLLKLIAAYVGNMDDGHAKVKMDEVREHINRTYFAWVGTTEDDSVYYYRVHSPVILIEFDHERRVAPFRSAKPTREHIHAVVRTPNGNDYGKDLLRQHYEKYHSKEK